MFIAHWVACFFWMVGSSNLDPNGSCWSRKNDLFDQPLSYQYITSLYWAFTTMVTVGYGDIAPTNTYERLYVMVAMLIASGVFAYTINSIGTIVSRYNFLAVQY